MMMKGMTDNLYFNLEQWETTNALPFIDQQLLVIYKLLAGDVDYVGKNIFPYPFHTLMISEIHYISLLSANIGLGALHFIFGISTCPLLLSPPYSTLIFMVFYLFIYFFVIIIFLAQSLIRLGLKQQ
jgi:hypothetical protein